MRKTIIAVVVLCLSALCARAQFYSGGSDPSYLKWFSTETPYYKIIYPEGTDSLARVYGRLLEQFREPVGHTLGTAPGDLPKGKKMPVVLHTHYTYSNGYVSPAPRGINLYTVPNPYASDPTPWEVQLAAHEPRHQAQFQYGYMSPFSIGSWIVGDGFKALVWALYLDWAIGEGDAVAAETGLATGTRARTADFLNYFRVAYDQGDFRTWNRWRYGSFKHYTPDYYKIGYMSVAGERVFGDNPMAVSCLMDTSLKKPWKIAPYNFRSSKNFRQYAEKFNAVWQEDAAARAPFMPEERISPKEAFPVFYSSITSANGIVYAIRNGYTRAREMVKYVDGKWEKVIPFATHTSDLFPDHDGSRLYWSETVLHPRWDLDGKSIVRYYDIPAGKVFDLTTEGRYYNPQPSGDGRFLAVADYPVQGGSAAVLLSAADGSVVSRFPAPDGVQVTYFGWLDNDLYAIAVEAGGNSLFSISPSGDWLRIMGPVPVKMTDLSGGDGCLEWTSDASGVNEFYNYYPGEGRLVKVTNTRYGGKSFRMVDDYLYYTTTALDGESVVRTPADTLPSASARVDHFHKYKVEDALTAQENALGGVDYNAPVEFTEPVRYRKLASALRFHTWLPLYVDYDAVMNQTFDISYENISPGLTAFFQNDLGTLYGAAGYAIHPNPEHDKSWRNALHAKLTYTGLFPVFEASFDLGDRSARQYRLGEYDIWGQTTRANSGKLRSAPSVSASLRAYVPLSYSKGGFLYGFTPQVRYTLSNNLYNTSAALYKAPDGLFVDLPTAFGFVGFGEGDNVFIHNASASLRGYFMLSRPRNRVYPKFGIGAEVGGYVRPGLTDVFRPIAYGYTYGYLPGLYQTHGLKLTAIMQRQINDAYFPDITINTLPRGFDGEVASAIAASNTGQWRITADYAMPFCIRGDLSLMPVTYIRNFVLTPHFDYTGFSEGNLWSAGIDFAADMEYAIAFAVDATVGISVSFLGGTWFGNTGLRKPWHIAPVFKASF